MNINYSDYKEIESIVEKFKDSNNYELEARLCSNKFNNKININYYKFKDILSRLILPIENGGMNLKSEVNTTLDITNDLNNIRLIITGQNEIKKFWLNNNLDFQNNKSFYKYLEKERIENKDINNYNLRFSLSKEVNLNLKNEKVKDSIELLNNNDEQKIYRFKNRYEIYFNKDFRIDMTSVRTSRGYTFKESQVLNSNNQFEIEVEALNNKNDKKYIIDNFIEIFTILLSIFNNFYTILTEDEKKKIIDNYYKLINAKESNNNFKRNAYNNNYKLNFIAVNPVTLHIKNIIKSDNIINIYKNYAISPKADGERNFLYIDSVNNNLYLINNRFEVKYTGFNAKGFGNTLIEGEYINNENLFLCYDILFFKNKDCRNKKLYSIKNKLDTRLGILNDFLKSKNIVFILKTLQEENAIKIIMKDYEFSNEKNVFIKINELIKKMDYNNLAYFSDGLIFTPINDFYPKKLGSWKSLLKWKPPNLNSIDFFVKIEKRKNKDLIQPIIINKNNTSLNREIKQYKILKLYVSSSNDIYNINKKSYNKNIIKKLFDPYNNNDESAKINKCFIVIDDNKIFANDPVNKIKDEILDETIVEFVYDPTKEDGFAWIPIRVRHDKTDKFRKGEKEFGNFETTANDIWNSLKYPVTKKMICTGEINTKELDDYNKRIENAKPYYNCIKDEYNPNKRLPLQHFHNIWIKKNLIKDYSPAILEKTTYPKGKLLDLACGKGGDLSKWKNAKFKEVISLDIDKSCVEYAINFFKTYPKPKPIVRYAWADTSKLIFPNQDSGMNNMQKKRLKEYINNKFEFDVVSCQFCIHYYFENEIKFRTLLQNVSDNIKIGGYFIGTCFNGKKIYDKLFKKKEIDGYKNNKLLWKIIKNYKTRKFDVDKPCFGMKIDVYIDSIGNFHNEYLVNFNYLKQELINYGFELVKHNNFEEEFNKSQENKQIKNILSSISDVEKEFSFLNDLFVFKKTKNTPDKYYQELMKLIDKSK